MKWQHINVITYCLMNILLDLLTNLPFEHKWIPKLFSLAFIRECTKKEPAIRSEFCHSRKESKSTYNMEKWTLLKGSLNLAQFVFCLQLFQAKSRAFMQWEIFSMVGAKPSFISTSSLMPWFHPHLPGGISKVASKSTHIHITWYLTVYIPIA